MQIGIIRTGEEFQELKPSWMELSTEPFKSWDWNYWWWKHFGDPEKLCIITAKSGDCLVGVAPFQFHKETGDKKLQFFGGGRVCTDYVQPIIKQGMESEFSKQLADELKNRNSELFGTTLIEIEGATCSAGLLDSEPLEKSYWNYQSELNSTWVVPLPNSWTEFVQGRNKSLRRKIRKAEKRFASGEATVQSTRQDLATDVAFETLVELHQERFVAKGEPGVFSDPKFKAFLGTAFEALASDGRAEILVCSIGDRPIVAQLYWLNSTGPQLYQSGIRIDSMKYEPGHLLFTHAFRIAIEAGCAQFDFLRGDESYKSFWGAEQVPLYLSRFVSRSVVSTFKHQLIRGLKSAKKWLKTTPLLQSRKLVKS